ncbi:AraC family ligand binding domain-containing protein, partial [Pedobacter sp. UBA5917]|uniref:AraC family ligand binding domain-containing protein n=1 Tax=Pedobacter sp. UBA5917 TaxID=1947061 RepID=UPI00260009F6
MGNFSGNYRSVMGTKNKNIPVNILPEGTYRGIMVMREAFDGAPGFEEVERSHRDGGYTFIIQERGSTQIEIDFQTYCIRAPSVMFIRPDQVHRLIAFEDAFISTSIITEDNIRAEYL